jgi:hypothetical protein
MIHQAEVFVLADEAALRVYSQVTGDQWDAVLPPLFDMPGADEPLPLRRAINHFAYDDSWVPDMLAGRTMDEVGRDRYDGDRLGDDPAGNLTRIVRAAQEAARKVTDPTATVHCSWGDVTTDDYLWQLNIARTIGAHDVAAVIGVDDGISEEHARGMYEGTAPTAELWRSFGIYRAPVEVPEDASWRDRYLALTGRRP